MARVVLTEEAVERSTFVVSVGFVDEAGAAVTPTAARWSLVDAFGQVVNGRDGVVIGALAATVEIVLAGADLQVLGGMDGGGRRLVVQADYFSLGQALTLNEEVEFVVRPLTMSGRSFSYGLTSEDATTAAVARVRLEIGDTTAGAGVLPDGGNLSDEEIGVVLAQYGFDVTETVRALAGVLARRWATLADVTVGPRSERLSQVSLAWGRVAAAGGGGGGFAMQPVKVDGFSERF